MFVVQLLLYCNLKSQIEGTNSLAKFLFNCNIIRILFYLLFFCRPTEVPVYNLTAGKENRLTWGEALERSRRLVYQYPFEMTVWYPDGNIHKSKVIHNLCIIFLHFLPAYLIDFLMLIFRQKRL